MKSKTLSYMAILLPIGAASTAKLVNAAQPHVVEPRIELRKTGVFKSPGDIFYVSEHYIESYEVVDNQQRKFAVRKVGGDWKRVPANTIRTYQPVALGSCDPLNQVDIGIQHPEFTELPSVNGNNLKQVIQTEWYALLVVLSRGSAAGGSDLKIILAIPNGLKWTELNAVQISSNAEFCVAQSIEAGNEQRSVYVFFNEPAGSGESFGVAAFDLDKSTGLTPRH